MARSRATMVAMAVVTGMLAAGLSHHSFLGDLGLSHAHAHGLEAIIDALPSSLDTSQTYL
jgi:tetrahydromethanopterin S-methyltransferase subunit B